MLTRQTRRRTNGKGPGSSRDREHRPPLLRRRKEDSSSPLPGSHIDFEVRLCDAINIHPAIRFPVPAKPSKCSPRSMPRLPSPYPPGIRNPRINRPARIIRRGLSRHPPLRHHGSSTEGDDGCDASGEVYSEEFRIQAEDDWAQSAIVGWTGGGKLCGISEMGFFFRGWGV
jgi:hypothetical protein